MEHTPSFENREQIESRMETTEAARELDEATFEPEARVERVESYQQAEAIEAAFVETVRVADKDDVSATPLPIPYTEDRVADKDDVSATPLPIPYTEDRVADKDDVSATPLPIPYTEDRLADKDEVSATPLPIPYTEDQVANRDEGSATPIPLPYPADRVTGEDDVSYIPIPLPEPEDEGVSSARPGTLSDAHGREVETAQASFTEQIQQGREGMLPEEQNLEANRGTGERMPGGGLPGEISGDMGAGIRGGIGDGLPGDLGGIIPGGSEGGMPGDPLGGITGGGFLDGIGGSLPGGFDFSNIPGSENPFGDPVGSPGDDIPGSGGLPGAPGAELAGGSGGGGGIGGFWEWNFLYEQEARYRHAKELTGMQEDAKSELKYDQSWSPEPAVDPRDSVDPLTGSHEEWGTPTTSDYDETDKDREQFYQEQRKYEQEKQKQEDAREQRVTGDTGSGPGSGGGDDEMTDGEGSRSQFASPERLNWTRLGGLLVIDPPRDDIGGGSPSGGGGFDPTAIGQEALTPEEGAGTAARDPNAPLRVDPSVITDPPEPEGTGKEVADKNV